VSGPPFGFGLPDPREGGDEPGEPSDSGGAGGFGAGGFGPGGFGFPGGQSPFGGMDLGAALQQLGRMLSWSGGPVNWDLAREAARATVAAAGSDPSITAADRRDVEEAVRLVDLWLDEATTFPASTTSVEAWSRAEWVERTLEGWRPLVEPVADRVAAAMANAIPGELAGQMGPMIGMMRQVGVSLWGAQAGQGLGALATEVIGVTDIGLPLTEPGKVAVVARNVREFGEGLGVPPRDVLVYLALREVARHRLHAHTPWLRDHIVALVTAFARGISIDVSGLQSALRDLDPSRPEAVQEALEGGLFDQHRTPDQEQALQRLETVLALVEGWVDDVVSQAVAGRLGSADALAESVRRSRASGGPADQTFATLVGLELRPRRMREAAALFAALRESGGAARRESAWLGPDVLPTPADLDDPAGYVGRPALEVEVTDDLIAQLLGEDGGTESGAGTARPEVTAPADPESGSAAGGPNPPAETGSDDPDTAAGSDDPDTAAGSDDPDAGGPHPSSG
jgi:putative hydrolase